jgi:hypothetical protein
MIAKTNCLNCGNGIEFDPEQLGNQKFLVINCPHCGKETVLTLQKAEPPQAIYVQPPPQSQKKGHGVFYYVFWGMVSLIATVFILGAGCVMLTIGLPAFLSGFNQARERSLQIQNTNGLASVAVNQKTDYIQRYLELYDATAKYEDSVLDGRVPGVDFKIRNNGDRILKKVEVTVYFKDASGKTISEKTFYPVLVTEFGSDNNPLKPGYIWQMETGHFYAAKNVPSEWSEGSADFKITDIEFLDSEK